MKPGSIIISYHQFDGCEFERVGTICQPTSWAHETEWIVYKVSQNSTPTSPRPATVKVHQIDAKLCCRLSAPPDFEKDISDVCFESFRRWKYNMTKSKK